MIVTRFAPSPTGLLHLGHAFAALAAWDAAKRAGGRFLLRMEDIDIGRCRPAFEHTIEEDLSWLGLDWEKPVRRQSEHLEDYAAALAKLNALGVLYPCFCTRKEIADEIARADEAPQLSDSGLVGPRYPGTCRELSDAERERRIASGTGYGLRLDSAEAARRVGALTFEERGIGPNGETGQQTVQPQCMGDVVVARKEMPTSYHLAVVCDDSLQGVTLVTRGEDLFTATHTQRLLQALLDMAPPVYAHHRLILNANGKKFAKRDPSVTLRDLREFGATPQQIRATIGWPQ